MRSSIEIPFAIGQQVWWVGNGHREEWVTCPECAGTKIITMILGNGEQVSLPCEQCRLGYDPATGRVKRNYFEHAPEPFTLGRVSVDGSEIRYSESGPDSTCYSSSYAKDLFATKEECQVRCNALNVEKAKGQEDMEKARLTENRRHMAYSVSYWRKQISRMERDLERTRGYLAVAIQKKAKKGEV